MAVERDPEKLIRNITERAAALTPNTDSAQIGELLFAVTNLSYALKINSEQALYEKNDRFIKETTKNEEQK